MQSFARNFGFPNQSAGFRGVLLVRYLVLNSDRCLDSIFARQERTKKNKTHHHGSVCTVYISSEFHLSLLCRLASIPQGAKFSQKKNTVFLFPFFFFVVLTLWKVDSLENNQKNMFGLLHALKRFCVQTSPVDGDDGLFRLVKEKAPLDTAWNGKEGGRIQILVLNLVSNSLSCMVSSF